MTLTAAESMHDIPGASVKVETDLTIYSAAAAKDTLLGALAGPSPISLDLRDVAEVDGAGIQLLLLVAREAQRSGKTVTLDHIGQEVGEVLGLCGLGSVVSSWPVPGGSEAGAR